MLGNISRINFMNSSYSIILFCLRWQKGYGVLFFIFARAAGYKIPALIGIAAYLAGALQLADVRSAVDDDV